MNYESRFRYLGQWISVEHYHSPEAAASTLGTASLDKQLVTLNTNRPSEAAIALTFLHELLHIADQGADAKMSEHQVEAISNQLFSIFRDNPWILNVLKGGGVDHYEQIKTS